MKVTLTNDQFDTLRTLLSDVAGLVFDDTRRESMAYSIAVLLTGMGRDGAAGMLTLREAGWTTIAQDQASSVVYGMPKAAAELGAAERVLPLSRIARAIIDAVETAVPARRVR
jgi:chemotaxis response regulator CheB